MQSVYLHFKHPILLRTTEKKIGNESYPITHGHANGEICMARHSKYTLLNQSGAYTMLCRVTSLTSYPTHQYDD